jgi:hypothetical protein
LTTVICSFYLILAIKEKSNSAESSNSNELCTSIQIVILERLNTHSFLLILFMRTFCVLSIGFENGICFLILCYSINSSEDSLTVINIISGYITLLFDKLNFCNLYAIVSFPGVSSHLPCVWIRGWLGTGRDDTLSGAVWLGVGGDRAILSSP